MTPRRILCGSALGCAALLLQSCGGNDDPSPPTEAAASPRVAGTTLVPGTAAQVSATCAALKDRPVTNGSITAASIVAAGQVVDGVTLPEHCRVVGLLEPRVGVDNVS